MANVMVQAQRYQFRPSGQRQLMEGSFGNFGMPGGTNDRGEYRIFGLRPGSYYVSARTMDMSGVIALAQSGGPGIGALDTNDGLATTFYPGTANAAEAQAIQVGLMQQASASFTLVPARMARISGTVLDSQGQPFSGARVMLRPTSAHGHMVRQRDGSTFIDRHLYDGERDAGRLHPRGAPESRARLRGRSEHDAQRVRITAGVGGRRRPGSCDYDGPGYFDFGPSHLRRQI